MNLLSGIAMQFYRGIGADTQFVGKFAKFNFFIGANNAGKSTVLSFLCDQLHAAKPSSDLDRHRGRRSGETWIAVGYPLDEFVQRVATETGIKELFVRLAVQSFVRHGMVWLTPPRQGSVSFFAVEPLGPLDGALKPGNWRSMWEHLTNASGGHMDRWISETLARLAKAGSLKYPHVALIPAIREIGPRSSEFTFRGGGLIDRLAEIQSPDHDKRADRQIFDRINAFVRDVVGKDDATIEIPHNRDHILVHLDNKVLPLSALGTGLHEVIMLAAFCTITTDQIVCIEEPEIHLHPVLQRKLVKHLAERTSNQYFVATHSAAFIDTPGAAIFHVHNDGEQTRITESLLRADRVNICVDLGYRASDLVQSNAIIWVEGPSDRIYLKHWISHMRPDLVEGIHYSIMFYGGRLLNHLTPQREIDEFINLRSLNQNLAIVIDSDKKSAHAPINDTKKRVRDAFGEKGELCWITKGREIENYVHPERLQEAVKSVYAAHYDRPHAIGQYDHALWFYRSMPKRSRKSDGDGLLEQNIDKLLVAKRVAESPADLKVLDLEDRLAEIIAMIDKANA